MANGVYVRSSSPLYSRTAFSSYSNLSPAQRGEEKPFSPPSEELRVANARRQARLNPQTKNNQPGQTRIAARIDGQNVEDAVQNTESANISGGSWLSVSGGAMEFKTVEGDSLRLEPGTEARFFRNDSGQLTLQNLENNESITVRSGEGIEIGGEGTAELSGANRNLTLRGGETIRAQAAQGQQTQLVRESTAASLALGDGKQISVEENTLTFLAEGGQSIEFGAGQTGEITRNENNQVTITNTDTGEEITFGDSGSLSAIGQGTASLGTQGELTIEGSQALQLSSNETGNTTLIQPVTAQTATVEELDREPGLEGRLSVQVYSDPQTERLKLSTEKLLREPLERARAEREENEEEAAEAEEAEAEEAEEAEAEEAAAAEAEAESQETDEAEHLFQIENEEEADFAVGTAAEETEFAYDYSAEAPENTTNFEQATNESNFYSPGGQAQLTGTSINYSV